MLFISVVKQSEVHRFIPCSAKHISSAKTMATKSVPGPGYKVAIAIGEYGQTAFVPVAELVFLPGQTWQSLCPSPHPVALALPSWGMGGMPPMSNAAFAPSPCPSRGVIVAHPCPAFAPC